MKQKSRLRQQLLDAACAVEGVQALVGLVDEAGAEGAQPQLRHGAVEEHLQACGAGAVICVCVKAVPFRQLDSRAARDRQRAEQRRQRQGFAEVGCPLS